MDRTKKLAASRYISRLNLKAHRHLFFELYICLEGSCEFLIDNDRFTLQSETFTIIPPQKQHTILGASEDFVKFILGFSTKDDSKCELLKSACEPIRINTYIPTEWRNPPFAFQIRLV